MKQKLIEAISVVLLLCVICILEQLPTTLGTGSYQPCKYTYVQRYNDVWLDCAGNYETNKIWKHQNTLLYWGHRAVASPVQYNMHLFSNYTLKLNNVTYQYAGNYTCIKGDETLRMHCILLHDSPLLSVTTDNVDTNSSTYIVSYHNKYIFKCQATSSSEFLNLTWYVENDDMTTVITRKTSVELGQYASEATYISETDLIYTPTVPEQNITCIGEGTKSRLFSRKSVAIFVYGTIK
ncbi:hypothetical protein BSL78_10539 [Apostichopus japonicus]|uniref:Ig-like domain-containing protein n=1 Tax=Stichopus japonicus TaxID=307972 RepID=A0A2G8KX29_STIJA|nr:hypothetical protein BSL78_10539 [Apostichopus japonicus]